MNLVTFTKHIHFIPVQTKLQFLSIKNRNVPAGQTLKYRLCILLRMFLCQSDLEMMVTHLIFFYLSEPRQS